MAADGSIVVVTDIDDKQAQVELNRLAKKIDGLNEKIKQSQNARMPLLEQSKQLAAHLDVAKAKLAEMQAASAGTYSAQQITGQKETVKSLQAQWNDVQRQVEGYDRSIAKSTADLEAAEGKAGELSAQLANAGESGANAGEETTDGAKKAATSFENLRNRIAGIAKQVFVFSVLSSALGGLRRWLSSAVQSNEQATAAVARLKGALLTLAQPLLEVVIPAFVTFVNILTAIVTKIASLVSGLFGKTLQQSKDAAKGLYGEQKALKGVGSAAGKASKQLAAFDEVNKLSAESAGTADGGYGGNGASGTSSFSPIDMDETIVDHILDVVLAIGAALLTWKIASHFTDELSTSIGLAMAVGGAVLFVTGLLDAWSTGIDFSNLIEMLGGLALAAIGLGVAFGPVAAGIALVVGGLSLLVLGIKDAMENGMNWANTLLMIGGILATGLGLALITGSFIPLFIAAIAGGLLALVMFTGHGEELMNGLRDIFGGFIDFITGIFSGDWEKAFAGLERMGEGFREVWVTIVQSIRDAWDMLVNWIDEKTNGQFHQIFETIGQYISGMYESLKTILSGVIEFISGVFTFDFGRAWEGVKNIFVGIINAIITAFEGFINLMISGINILTQKISSITIDIPDWVPLVGGESWGVKIPPIPLVTLERIPALAQGAVIPPNREFLAVLGDQKQGTNVEAPLATIEQAFRNVMAEQGNSRSITIVMEIDRREFGRAVYRFGNEEAQRVGVKLGGVG